MSDLPVVILTGVKVFDGSAFADPGTEVAVRGDRFVAVGPGLVGSAEFAGAQVRDLTGSTVTPGLIDCHVHLLGEHIGSLTSLVRPFSSQFYDSIRNARTTLELGITTAREAGGADKGLREAIDSGAFPGPRLRLAITMMSQTGGHGDMHLDSGVELPFLTEHPGRPAGVADGIEGVRHAVRTILRAGADQIKIASTGGVLSPTDDPNWSQFTVDEIKAIVYEAEAQDKYVMAHAIGTRGILNALHGGVRSIEHGIFIDDECIDYMLENDRYLVPTLIAPLFVIKDAEAGLPVRPETLEKAKRVAETHREACARAIAAGVSIAFGTDSGVGQHGQNLEELEHLADAGMTLEGVLAAATSVAAELMKLSDEVGSIAPGLAADFVVFDEVLGTEAQLHGLKDHVREVWKGGAPALAPASV